MSALLVDTLQLQAGHLIMCADDLYRFVDFRLQVAVQQKIHLHIGIAVADVLQHISHGRTEAVQVLLGPVRILVFADGCSGPAVVRTAEYQDDVRAAQVVHPRHERAVGIVRFLVAGMADGRTRKGVVHTQAVSAFLNELVPPRLADGSHIVLI